MAGADDIDGLFEAFSGTLSSVEVAESAVCKPAPISVGETPDSSVALTTKPKRRKKARNRLQDGNEASVGGERKRKVISDGTRIKVARNLTEAPAPANSRPIESAKDDGALPPPVAASSESSAVNDVIVEVYKGDHNCVHECVRPANPDTVSKDPDSQANKPVGPARTYTYELDPFQATAIKCLEQGESVLVAAHTSAGKTTVADYAVAMGLLRGQRVIYTSPIKALSNQKYRDMNESKEGQIGLMTGDTTLNATAPVIVMTTEILRSMIYRGSSHVKEVKWVIFDEIHYMRDRGRGVVWEEAIILLPDTVRLVFLSATIPNAREFAEWICRIKHQPCHIVYTDHRPVPLQHYLFPVGADGVFLVVDERKNFREENFHQAIQAQSKVVESLQNGKQMKKKSGMKGAQMRSDLEKVIRLCSERSYVPLIVFSFSKNDVETNAVSLKDIDLLTETESQYIEKIFNSAMLTLNDKDRNLPQIQQILPILKRGIGMHHGGLLPIVKEVIELLFQESLIKVLFSTETFAMGINMPAKTVVFTAVRKFDGIDHRLISAGEYIQMSGRAGRRGIDDRGLAIVMFDERLEPEEAKALFLGEPLRIESAFHLGYNMLLNLLRVPEVAATPEYMIRRSFYQLQQDKLALGMEEEKRALEQDLEKLSDICSLIDLKGHRFPEGVDVNDAVADYFAVQHDLDRLYEEFRAIVFRPQYVAQFLHVGRIVKAVDSMGSDWDYGMVTESIHKRSMNATEGHKRLANGQPVQPNVDSFVVGVLLLCDRKSVTPDASKDAAEAKLTPLACSRDRAEEGVWHVVTLPLTQLKEITQIKTELPQNVDVHNPNVWQVFGNILMDYLKQAKLPLLTLDPHKDLRIEEKVLDTIYASMRECEVPLMKNPLRDHPLLKPLLEKYTEKMALETRIRRLEGKLQAHKHLAMQDSLKGMRTVLRRLGYVGPDGLLTMKGQAACEISTVDELLVCELLFENVFLQLRVDYVVALLSCLVFEEKSTSQAPPTNPQLLQGYEKIREVARRIADVSTEAKLPIDAEAYVEKFKPTLMELILKWMRGASFGELLNGQEIYEGSLVRSMRRLEELLRQLAVAAKILGNSQLQKTFVEGFTQLKRDIAFSASLYL